MQGQLTADQQLQLQKQLGLLNHAIQQQAVNTGQYNAVSGRTGMQNQYDLGQQQIGLNSWNAMQNQYQQGAGL